MKYLIAFVMPAFIIALAIPMATGRVRPNSMWGFRTAKSLSSRELWYASNRAAGRFMIAGLIIAIIFNVVIWWTQPDWPAKVQLRWMAYSTVVAVILSGAVSVLYTRRL